MSIILHIPHSSQHIPKEYLPYFLLNKETLKIELLKMTDHYTSELFLLENNSISTITFPVSRLLVDPERFENDLQEPMTDVGMGCIYTKTHDQKPLKEIHEIKNELISKFYRPHHLKFTKKVNNILEKDHKVIIIDCHSFPKYPLPYELNQVRERAEICIGTDEFHTPNLLKDGLVKSFEDYNLSVSINTPFSGSIVPIDHYQKDKRVQSIMIEIRRDLYMNEETGAKIDGFFKMKKILESIISKFV